MHNHILYICITYQCLFTVIYCIVYLWLFLYCKYITDILVCSSVHGQSSRRMYFLFIYCIFISTQSVGISINFVRRSVVNHWWSIHIFTTQRFRSYRWRFLDRQHHNVGTSAVWCNQSQTWLIPMGQWEKDWGFSPKLFDWDANRWVGWHDECLSGSGSSRRMDGQEVKPEAAPISLGWLEIMDSSHICPTTEVCRFRRHGSVLSYMILILFLAT